MPIGVHDAPLDDVVRSRHSVRVRRRGRLFPISRYDTLHVEIYTSARKHGIDELDILHALGHSVASGEQDDGKVLYLGPDRSGNLLEVVSVLRNDGTEIVIHAMRMRRIYESFRHDKGDPE